MMAAVQPFISGAISKTVNMPEASTADEIAKVYVDGWKLGLKAIAVYRDNSKRSQPLNMKKEGRDGIKRRGGPRCRPSTSRCAGACPMSAPRITHKFNVGGHEGYLTIGMYEDGTPGEIFLRMAKEGSTISGLMDSFATAISLALQYGVPLKDLVNKFSHLRFEPAGFTGNRDIPMAKSLVDYIFRYMATKFMSQDEKDAVGIINRQLTLSEAKAGEWGGGYRRLGRAALAAAAPLATRPRSRTPPQPQTDSAPAGPLVEVEDSADGIQLRLGGTDWRPSGTLRLAEEVGGANRAAGWAEDRGAERGGEGSGGAARGGPGAGRVRHGGLAGLHRLRLDHGPQRLLLQVHQLRRHQRL